MAITITKRGRKPGSKLRGRCKNCGARIKCDAADAVADTARPEKGPSVRCPELGCGNPHVRVN